MIDPLPNAEGLRTTGAVQPVRSDARMFGAGIAEGLKSAASSFNRGAYLIGRAKRRKDYEAADAAYTQFENDMDGAFSGQVDAEGNLAPGLKARTLGDAEGVAADYAKRESEWMDNPEGAFAKLSPEQQKLFRTEAGRFSARMKHQAAGYEYAEMQKQRTVHRKVKAGVKAQTAANAYGTDTFTEAAAEAAAAAADAEVGDNARVDPETGEREFKNDETRAAWTLVRDQESEKLRVGERKYFLDKARESDVDDADVIEGYIAAAEKDMDKFSPQAQTAVRNAVKDLNSSVARQRKARIADARQAEIEASRDERGRIDELRQKQLIGGFKDTQAYVRALSESPESSYANQMIAEVNAVKAARANATAKNAEKALTEEQKRNQDYIMAQFAVGGYVDSRSGNVVMMTPEKRIDSAVYAFTKGNISESQMKSVIKGAEAMKDQRISQFQRMVLNSYIPKKALAIEIDDQGRFMVSDDLDKKGRRRYMPDDKSGIKREWTQEGRFGFDQHKENVLLSQMADAMNLMVMRMQVDKNMTAEGAAKLFGDLTQGHMQEYAKKSWDEMMMQEGSMYQQMKARQTQERVKNIRTIRESVK